MDLGCINYCGGEIDTTLAATLAGEYTLKLYFNGRVIEKKQTFAGSEPLVFNTEGIPQDYLFRNAELLSSGGSSLGFYTFKIIVNYDV